MLLLYTYNLHTEFYLILYPNNNMSSPPMAPTTTASLDDAYRRWEDAERHHAHFQSVHAILDTLRPEDTAELAYQTLRLRYSPAYFTGHPLWCGELLSRARIQSDAAVRAAWGKWVSLWLLLAHTDV